MSDFQQSNLIQHSEVYTKVYTRLLFSLYLYLHLGKMVGNQTFCILLDYLDSPISHFPDFRRGANTQYSIRDAAALSAFSVFFTQSPSFLAYQKPMQYNKGNNNGRTLFGINQIPCDNQIRSLLDPVRADFLSPVFYRTFQLLQETGVVEKFRSFNTDILIALDGTWFFSSNKIHCDNCSTQEHRNGKTTYYHNAVIPAVVVPGGSRVIPLAPEFIRPQDGKEKQDCETAAGKRWINANGAVYSGLGVTLLGDDLYSRQPLCLDVLANGFNFIFVCKPSSHKCLSGWLAAADPKEDLHEFSVTQWTGKEHLTYTYQYANGVPLKDGEDALLVNWAQLTITNESGEVTFRNSFVSNHTITRENVEAFIEAGRTRWKIENENNNTLKTKGYHFEHNFGHGKKNLTETLLCLNLLSFLFHTVLEIFDNKYRLIRETLPRRKDFFNDIRALTTYICFDGWNQLLDFMIRGLELPNPEE